jgi:acid phosphatase type 7
MSRRARHGVLALVSVLLLAAMLVVARHIDNLLTHDPERPCAVSEESAELRALPSSAAADTLDSDPGGATVLAAGDIGLARCPADDLTADLAARYRGPVLALGDLAYPNGTASDFVSAFEPSWGPLGDRIRPVPGNHDYHDHVAAAYFDYFGTRAGTPGEGWYSFDINGWHLVALNSNCAYIGGCGSGSRQERWLRDDLAAHPAQCVLAFSHHPRFSSARHGADPDLGDVWSDLEAAGAELLLSGHDHVYERFAPQDSRGRLDQANGIRQFVVGTGGRSLYPRISATATSEVRNNRAFGLLKLTLWPDRYAWEFIAIDGSVVDSGAERCH